MLSKDNKNILITPQNNFSPSRVSTLKPGDEYIAVLVVNYGISNTIVLEIYTTVYH